MLKIFSSLTQKVCFLWFPSTSESKKKPCFISQSSSLSSELQARNHSHEANDGGADEQDDYDSCPSSKPSKEFQSQFMYSPLLPLKSLASQLALSTSILSVTLETYKYDTHLPFSLTFSSPFANLSPLLLLTLLTGLEWRHKPSSKACDAAKEWVRESPPRFALMITCKPWLFGRE